MVCNNYDCVLFLTLIYTFADTFAMPPVIVPNVKKQKVSKIYKASIRHFVKAWHYMALLYFLFCFSLLQVFQSWHFYDTPQSVNIFHTFVRTRQGNTVNLFLGVCPLLDLFFSTSRFFKKMEIA